MKNIFKTKDTSMYEIYLTGEDLKDLANVLAYHNLQHQNYKRGKKPVDFWPSFDMKSMVHYRRLLESLDGQVDDI